MSDIEEMLIIRYFERTDCKNKLFYFNIIFYNDKKKYLEIKFAVVSS